MSNNSFNSEVAARVGSVYPNNTIRLFQNLSDKTLCVIGTSHKGKAFVPTNVTDIESINDLNVINNLDNTLGTSRNNRYRNLFDNLNCIVESQSYDALKVWLDNGGDQSTFIRVLGIGSGIKSNQGNYIGAGFNVEKNVSKGSTDDLTRSDNPNAVKPISVNGNISFVLNHFTQNDLDYIEDLGLKPNEENYFITSSIISAQGILPTLNLTANDSAASYNDQLKIKQTNNINFTKLKLLGLQSDNVSSKTTSKYNKYIMKPYNNNHYKSNISNDFFLERGHIVYSQYPPINLMTNSDKYKIITTRNYDSLNNSDLPNFNSFEQKYQTAKTPWVTSQPINRSGIEDNRQDIHNKVVNLFRFYSLDDGEIGNRFRIKINLLTRGDIEDNVYSTFEIYVFEYNVVNFQFTQIDHKEIVTLDPDDPNYIARLFGDENTYYDIELKKVTTSVKYEQRNMFLRVEVSSDVEDKKINCDLMPSGFRSYPHIRLNSECFPEYNFDFDKIFHMPVHYSPVFLKDDVLGETSLIQNNWGCIFKNTNYDDTNNIISLRNLTKNDISPFFYHTKYFLSGMSDESKNIWVEDDAYLNSFFHLEKLYSENGFANDNIKYSRKSASVEQREYLNLNDLSYWDNDKTLKADLKDKLSFDFFTYGGFDGVDIRDLDKKHLNNNALLREVRGEDPTVPFDQNPTYKAYTTAIDLINENVLNTDYITIPGISSKELTQKCVDICENSKDKFMISDILTYNSLIKESILKVKNEYEINNQTADKIDTIESVINVYKGEYSNVINNQTLNSLFNSKYLLYVYGTLHGVNANDLSEKILDPSVFVIKRIAQDLNNITSLVYSEKLNGYDLSLIQSQLDYQSDDWGNDTKKLRENYINALFFPSGQGVNLNSQTTSFNKRNSSFSVFSIINKLLKVKKEIKISLMTQNIAGLSQPLLFSQNSSVQNLNARLEIQLRNILDNLVNNNVITNYNVKIPSIVDNQSILDAQNYIIRGTISLQFNENNSFDIINIELNDILKEISLLSGSSAEEIIEARF